MKRSKGWYVDSAEGQAKKRRIEAKNNLQFILKTQYGKQISLGSCPSTLKPASNTKTTTGFQDTSFARAYTPTKPKFFSALPPITPKVCWLSYVSQTLGFSITSRARRNFTNTCPLKYVRPNLDTPPASPFQTPKRPKISSSRKKKKESPRTSSIPVNTKPVAKTKQRAPPKITTVSFAISPQEQKIVRRVLGETNARTTVVYKYNIRIVGQHIHRLRPGQWLNDELINFYMELINSYVLEHQSSCHRCKLFNSFFYELLSKRGSGYEYNRVSKWTKNIDIFSFDKVIIPIHLGSHWCLAVLDILEKQVIYHDSLGGRNVECTKRLLRYVQDEYQNKHSKKLDMKKWKAMSTERSVPQQNNGYDCGVFACQFAVFSALGKPFVFSQTDMPDIRKRMALEISQEIIGFAAKKFFQCSEFEVSKTCWGMELGNPVEHSVHSLRALTKDYVLKNIINIPESMWGLVVLVLDSTTMLILDSAMEMAQVTRHGIADIGRIDKVRMRLPKLDAIYFLTPTVANVQALIGDFKDGDKFMYRRAHVYWTSKLDPQLMQLIATQQVCGRLATFKIANLEYMVYDSQTFHLGTPKSFYNLYGPSVSPQQSAVECRELGVKVASLMATLGEYPIVRFLSSSNISMTVAQQVKTHLDEYYQAHIVAKDAKNRGQLIIVERMFDILTPVVHEVYYETMVGDCVRPSNNVIHSPYVDSKGQSAEYVVILNENDPVWIATRHMHIKNAKDWILDHVKTFTEQSRELQASGDITKMMRLMPNYQLMKTKYSVHTKLYKQCLDYWTESNMEKITEIEQILATGQDDNGKRQGVPAELMNILKNPDISMINKIRLLMLLYATYPDQIKNRAHIELGIFDRISLTLLDEWSTLVMRRLPRKDQRRPPHDGEWKFKTSRYLPAVYDIIKDVIDNSLPLDLFPPVDPMEEQHIAESAPPPPAAPEEDPFIDLSMVDVSAVTTEVSNFFSNLFGAAPQPPPRPEPTTTTTTTPDLPPRPEAEAPSSRSRITVFIIGGVSLSEMRVVHNLCKEQGRDILIGSTHIIDPNSFMDQVCCLSMSIQNVVYADSFIGDEVDEDRAQQEAQFGGPPKYGSGPKVNSTGARNYNAPSGSGAPPSRPTSGFGVTGTPPPRPPSYGGSGGMSPGGNYGGGYSGRGQGGYGAVPPPAGGRPPSQYGAQGFGAGGRGSRPQSQYGGWGQR